MKRRILKATCMAALVSLALSASAQAGEYHVYACRTPAGEAAPADGWVGTQGPTDDSYAKDTCAEGGALIAALGDQSVHLANATEALWSLSVPSAETVVGGTLWRAGDADGGSSEDTWYSYALLAPGQFHSFDWCTYWAGCPTGQGNPAEPLAAANRVAVPAADLGSHIYMSATCWGLSEKAYCPAGKGDANGYAAVVYLYAAESTLEQNEGPIAKEASGPLATEATVQGTSDLTFNATDPGAGVWEVTFAVDGQIVQSTVPDDNRGRCRDVGQTTDGTAGFLYLQPCPPAESADVGFNTTVLSNGEHHPARHALRPGGELGDCARPRDQRPKRAARGAVDSRSTGEARPETTGASARHAQRRATQGDRRTEHLHWRAAARRPHPQARQEARAGGTLAAREVVAVRAHQNRTPRPLPRDLSVRVPRAGALADPGAVRSGARLSVRDRYLTGRRGTGRMNSQNGHHRRAVGAPVSVAEPVACRDSFHDSFAPTRTRRFVALRKRFCRACGSLVRAVGGHLGGPGSASFISTLRLSRTACG